MKRFTVLVLVMVALMSAFIIPAAAQDDSNAVELNALARYFPEASPFLVSFRTDDAFFATLEDLAVRLDAIEGLDIDLPPTRILDSLDLLANELVEGGTFANLIRAWLGDTGSFGALDTAALIDTISTNDQDALVVALEVTDRQAAQAFLEEVLFDLMGQDTEISIETIETDEYNVYEVQGIEANTLQYFAVFEDVLFLGASELAIPLDGFPQNTLADMSGFASALNELPADSYNFTAYVDLRDIVTAAADMARADASPGVDLNSLDAFTGLIERSDRVVVGGTILNERSLTLDIAQPINADAPEIVPAVDVGAIDPTFARYIPTGTPIVIHSTNLQASYDGALESLRYTAEAMNDDNFDAESIESIVAGIAFTVRGVTGLEFEEEVLSWMTGDYALYVSLNDNFPTGQTEFSELEALPFEIGFVLEATDPAQAQALVSGLSEGLAAVLDDTENVTVSTETISGVEALVLTSTGNGLPFPVELVIAANAEVFVIGTRGAAEAALSPGASLADDPAFTEAAGTLLADARQVWYLSGAGLAPLADLAAANDADNADDIRVATNLIYNATISQTITVTGTTISRAVITLPE